MGSKSNQELLEVYQDACNNIAKMNNGGEGSRLDKSLIYELEAEILFRMDREDISLVHSFGRSCSSLKLCQIKGEDYSYFLEQHESSKKEILKRMF